MSALGGLGTALGAVVGSVVPGVGTALGATVGGGLGSAAGGLFGGGGSGSGGGGSSQAGDSYLQFAQQMAAANSPLTAAYQGLSAMQGALAGAIGQQGTTQASAQLGILTEGLQRAQKEAQLLSSTAGYTFGKGIDALADLQKAKLSTNLQAPQFAAAAGAAGLAGENQMANLLGQTNIGVRGREEATAQDIAKKQTEFVGQSALNRSNVEGQLALGAQQFTSAAELGKLNVLGDLARTKAQTKGQLAIKKFGANQALAGARMFA